MRSTAEPGSSCCSSSFVTWGWARTNRRSRMVRETLSLLSADHLVQPYLKRAGSMRSDAVLVDTFLHGRERSYTVDDCIDLVTNAGLVFQGWFNKAPYYPHDPFARGPTRSIRRSKHCPSRRSGRRSSVSTPSTPATSLWRAARSGRRSRTQIDFSTQACLDYVPLMRMRCGLSGNEIYRSDWRTTLNSAQLPFVQQVDGKRTIREIAASVHAEASSRGSVADVEKFARKLFQALWRSRFPVDGVESGLVTPGDHRIRVRVALKRAAKRLPRRVYSHPAQMWTKPAPNVARALLP